MGCRFAFLKLAKLRLGQVGIRWTRCLDAGLVRSWTPALVVGRRLASAKL